MKDVGGKLTACIYKCEPYDLVFDPGTQVCVFEIDAPPGTCFDTPPPNSTTTPPMTTTTTTTTTPRSTTTTPTTTPRSTTTTPTTTTGDCPACQCTYVGEMLPYPGDCHKYYRCLKDAGGEFYVELYTCGDWVFDPNQASCTWPEQAAADLCNE